MKKSNRLMFCAVMLVASQFCCGYINPTTGSLVIQMVIAVSVGGLFAVKLYWKNLMDKIRGFFGKKSKEEDPDSEE